MIVIPPATIAENMMLKLQALTALEVVTLFLYRIPQYMARILSVCMQMMLKEKVSVVKKKNMYCQHTSSDAGKATKTVVMLAENMKRPSVPK